MPTSDPAELQAAKSVVLDHLARLDTASDDDLAGAYRHRAAADYAWRGVHPFHELVGVDEVVGRVWRPLRNAFSSLQRRPDVFFAGHNHLDGEQSAWVCQMGHLMGLFDQPWLGIRPTGKVAFLRYAEFHRVDGEQIAESAFFCDILSVMHQAGQYPLPPATGAMFVHPGPRTHDGLLIEPQDAHEGRITLELVNRMIEDLDEANRIANATGDDYVPPEELAKSWHDDMIWYGPAGIGASYTIPRYQQQHQFPFRFGLTDKVFNGHVTRFAEGHYGGFFGWPNLTNRSTGGFLGMPASEVAADMRVVDIYRREGDKLAENWVFIDLLHWLNQQGLDVLARLHDPSGRSG